MDGDLTDDELRNELIDLGQNVGPITATTRKVWIKRLAGLRREAKKSTPKALKSRKLVGLSSDDSQQSDDAGQISAVPKRGTPKSRSSRLSTRAGASQVSKSATDPTLSKEKKSNSPRKTSSLQTRKTNSRRLAEYSVSESDGNSSEEMDVEETNGNHVEYKPVLPLRRKGAVPSYLYSTVTGRRSLSDLRHSSGGTELASGSESTYLDDWSSPPRSMLSMGINTTPSLDSTNSFSDSMSMGHSLLSDDSSTPFKTNHVSNSRKDFHDKFATHGFKTKEDDKRYFYPQYVSWGLVLSVIAIFVGIACIYMVNLTVHSREMAGDQKGPESLSDNMSPSDRCVFTLLDHLSTVAGDSICNSSPSSARVSVSDAKVQAEGSSSKATWQKCLQKLLDKPEWGIRLYTSEGSPAGKPSEVTWLESERPKMSFSCRLVRSLRKLAIVTAVVVLGLFLVGGVVHVYGLVKRRKEEAQRQFYDLVEEIMDTLQQHTSACKSNKDLKPYLAIVHVRDMLISPGERREKKKLWESAVKFLDLHESRVRTEAQVIQGEEFLVWRWLPAVSESSAPVTTQSGRVWQGQAFADTKTTKPHYSPTAFLKVRNMFDACIEFGDEWPVTIQDAILEKCLSTCPEAILHVAVDKNSKEGCVYIKCDSRDGASLVYKALHGWWFDGKLVTVKYLRSERYLERFPESESFTKPLSPSNTNRLSLANQD